MDEWNFDDFNFDSEMDGQWNRHTEMEVCFKTYDGTQHLRLHGWLKRNDVLIKMEQFTTEKERKNESHFGSFIVFITEKTLEKLKEENLEMSSGPEILPAISNKKSFIPSSNFVTLSIPFHVSNRFSPLESISISINKPLSKFSSLSFSKVFSVM